jgi:uncharacterized protein (TIGR00255 family)
MQSMTGFAVRRGAGLGQAWMWELRGVNGKGLELRLKLPDGIDALEPQVRARLQAALSRGNVSASLRLQRDGGDAAAGLQVDPGALEAAVHALRAAEAAATGAGVALAPSRASDLLMLRGVLSAPAEAADADALRAALLGDLDAVLTDFTADRAREGAALRTILLAHLGTIEGLLGTARTEAALRPAQVEAGLHAALARLKSLPEAPDAGRLAQELALIAVRQDITEELDRLDAHVVAARVLISDTAPAGRKLDFLAQEFMREANTLCSKAQSTGLTRVGLDLKSAIDQMREQLQNVE